MLGVRLPYDLEEKLTRLAKKTGHTKSYYAKKALERFLEQESQVHAAHVPVNFGDNYTLGFYDL